MALDYDFIFPLHAGLHARPASYVGAVAHRFTSEMKIVNLRTGAAADAKSVLSIIAADILHRDKVRITISGADEAAALAAIKAFLQNELANCDEGPQEPLASAGPIPIPCSLETAGLKAHFRGIPACRGVGRGKAVVIGALALPGGLKDQKQDPAGAAAEQRKAATALSTVAANLEAKIAAAGRPQINALLKAHLAIVQDATLSQRIESAIREEHLTAVQAVVAAAEFFAESLRNSQSLYLRQRVLDIQDVAWQLLDALGVKSVRGHAAALTEPSICVAVQLTPGQLLGLDRRFLRGLVLGAGGEFSHTVILARSMEIPTLIDAAAAVQAIRTGEELIVDANIGLVIREISAELSAYYEQEQKKAAAVRKRLAAARQAPAKTADGQAITVQANISSAAEAEGAFAGGAEGIGVFRTEMLFMHRDTPPTEEEQTDAYTRAVAAGLGRPVTIRLLDIGGDKPVSYLNLPDEENPFLGYRGVRIYPQFADLIQTQMRAILRSSSAGKAQILVPMVSCIEEVVLIKQMLEEAQKKTGTSPVPLGVMVEVPSAAYLIGRLAWLVQFFSIGSNDLAQFFLATDRANARMAKLYGWAHPAFLQFLASIVEEARRAGRPVGLCGEMADNLSALPLLVGMGMQHISLSAPNIGRIKESIGRLKVPACRKLLERALSFSSRREVETELETFGGAAANEPILAAGLMLSSHAPTRQAVIKEMCDALETSGRVEAGHWIEHAVWQREQTYSTGVGFGVAVPHCKSDHLRANSIVVSRMEKPVDWASADGNPVDVAILLAVRAQDHGTEHMRIFAQLSRLLMREEFRDQLRREENADKLLEFLRGSLSL